MKIVHRLLSFSLMIAISAYAPGFENLDEARTFAKMVPEHPAIDNDNLLKPDYSSFYNSRVPSRFQRLKWWLGVGRPLWQPQDFFNLIADLAQERENNGYLGRIVEKRIPKKDDRYYIFSDIHGGYHSFVRMLTQLEREGIIDNTFQLKQKIYFVFNGNVIDIGPYPLETLTLVARLLKKNPRTTFYIRGMHEDLEYWYDNVLRDQLDIMASHLSNETIPFNSVLRRFFNTLPLALYLMSYEQEVPEAVKIVSLEDFDKEIDEASMGHFFSNRNEVFPDIYKLDQKKPTEGGIRIKAIIRPDIRGLLHVPLKGLRKDESIEGATVWSTLTTPIQTNRTLYEFFVDAYVVITIREKMSEWTISLFNHDVREPGFIKQDREFELLSGDELIDGKKVVITKAPVFVEQQAPQVQQKESPQPIKPDKAKKDSDKGNEIIIGTTLDLSGKRKEGAASLRLGINLAFDEANQQGGIHGKNIRLVALDDEFKAKIARQNVEKLLSVYKTDIILAPFGYEPLSGFIDMVKEGKIAVLFPSTGAEKAHDPGIKNMVHMRASYKDVDVALIRYAEKDFKPKKMAFVYSSGESAFDVDKHIKEAKLTTEYKEFIHKEDEMDFSSLIKELKEYNPDVIGAFSYAAEEFVRQLDVDFLVGKIILLTESEQHLRRFLVDKGIIEQVVISQNLPNPQTDVLQIIKDYRKAMGTRAPDNFSFEGYVAGRVLVDILRKIKGSITKESVIEQARKVQNSTLGGLIFDYVESRQQLYHTLWLDQGKLEWKELNLREIIGY